jgi:hypothetical protein
LGGIGAGTGEGSLLTPGESGMSRQSNEYTKSPFEVFPIGKHNTGLPTLSIGGAGARFGVCAKAGDERSTNAKDAFFISTSRLAYYTIFPAFHFSDLVAHGIWLLLLTTPTTMLLSKL